MHASEARYFVQDSMRLKGEPTPEEWASSALELIYTKIREKAKSGTSSYIFTLPATSAAQIQFHTKVLAIVVVELRKNDFAIIILNKSNELAIKIQW